MTTIWKARLKEEKEKKATGAKKATIPKQKMLPSSFRESLCFELKRDLTITLCRSAGAQEECRFCRLNPMKYRPKAQ